jgi:hypothetical protein
LLKQHKYAIDRNASVERVEEDERCMEALLNIFFRSTGMEFKLQQLIMGSLLKYWKSFLVSIKAEPSGRFHDSPEKHPFVEMIYMCLDQSGTPISVWDEW